MKNIRIFYLKNCHFLVVKFSVYLNRRVFVMKLDIVLTRTINILTTNELVMLMML